MENWVDWNKLDSICQTTGTVLKERPIFPIRNMSVNNFLYDFTVYVLCILSKDRSATFDLSQCVCLG